MTAWKFGNYDLSSFGAVTLADDSFDMADRRGDNQVIPFRHGSIFVEKYLAERILLFGLTIYGQTPAEVEGLCSTLRTLAAVRAQQTLTKTTQAGKNFNVLATIDKAFEVSRPAPHVAKLSLQFTLTQPFFRSDTLLPDNTTVISANPTAMTVDNIGELEELEPIITLTGPLSNTVMTNSTNGCILTYTGTIASPRIVTIQKSGYQWVATNDLGANVIGNITHSGDASLLKLNQGINLFSIADATHTTGSVKVSFYPTSH